MMFESSPAMNRMPGIILSESQVDAGPLVISVGPKSVSFDTEIDLAAAQFGEDILRRPSQ